MYIVLLSWNSLPVFVRMPIPCTAYELECLKNMFRNECLYVNILGKMQMDKKDGWSFIIPIDIYALKLC